MAKLTKEEQELLASYESGEWKSVKHAKTELNRYRIAARTTFQKDQRVNIRISSRDLEGVQKKALEEGIPYQTLIASIIHKYVAGALVPKRA